MEEACDIMQLPWVFRKGVLLLNSMQVRTIRIYPLLHTHIAFCSVYGNLQGWPSFKAVACLSSFLRINISIAGIQINDEPSEFFRTTAKAAGIINLVEQYPWDGSYVMHSRRDKRRGQHSGRVFRSPGGATIE